MRPRHTYKTGEARRYRRRLRIRAKVRGTAERPRLAVYRSSKHIYAQLVDDDRGVTLVGASDRSDGLEVEGTGKTAKSFALGRLVARRATERGVKRVVFDRGGYQYHGRVKAVADGARKGGLEF